MNRYLFIALLLVGGCDNEASLYQLKHASNPVRKPVNEQNKGCTIAAVQRVVRPHLDKVRRCYRKGLSRNIALAGRLVVEIDIDLSGKARFLGVKEDTLKDTEVTRCVFKVLKPLAYPYPMQDKCVVIYPFNFTASPTATKT